jgi:flagellar basal body-associated protein FliL
MKNITINIIIGIALNMLLSMFAATSTSAMSLSDVLAGIDSVKRPSTMKSISFEGDMVVDVSGSLGTDKGLIPEKESLSIQWRAPNDWLCIYQSGGETGQRESPDINESPVTSHELLARPDLLDILYRKWTIEYQGSALWDGAPAWQLLVRPTDLKSETPPFNLYVRKDDFMPLRVAMTTPDGTEIETDMTWVNIDGVAAPSKFTTRFAPALGPLKGFETTFYNHRINPDLSDVVFPREEARVVVQESDTTDDVPPVFEELYHGFADKPIVVKIADSSGTYDRLSFTFSLYVEDRDLMKVLEKRDNEIRELVANVMAGREWSGNSGLSNAGVKYQAGKDITAAINQLLLTDKITDFYFDMFKPLKPGM